MKRDELDELEKKVVQGCGLKRKVLRDAATDIQIAFELFQYGFTGDSAHELSLYDEFLYFSRDATWSDWDESVVPDLSVRQRLLAFALECISVARYVLEKSRDRPRVSGSQEFTEYTEYWTTAKKIVDEPLTIIQQTVH